MSRLNLTLTALALCLGAEAASAATYTAILTGAAEVPPNASPAMGSITAELTGSTLELSGSFSGLLGNFTASHIHNAAAGVNGSVVVGLVRTPAGATAGSYEVANNTFLLSAAQVAQLEAGNFYVNVHSTVLPGGEIRGQLLEEETAGAVDQPLAFSLEQNHPNPFNPMTNIPFSLEETGRARLVIHNILGQPVATLVDEVLARGAHQARFSAGSLPSGLYTYTLDVDGVSRTRSMLLLR